MMFRHMKVHQMKAGDRFLTDRSGWVTAVSEPWQVLDSSTYEITVRRESDGREFNLVGPNRYTVERPDSNIPQHVLDSASALPAPVLSDLDRCLGLQSLDSRFHTDPESPLHHDNRCSLHRS